MAGNSVFVVHGRNSEARNAMHAFLRSVKLKPIAWEDAAALTNKGAPTTLEIVRAGIEAAQCTVVLMTGDDMACVRRELGSEPLTYQPRPNVIFEAGWALAIGGQERTVLVKFGALREFSDLSGVNMVELDNSPERREALVQRLASAGCPVKRNGNAHLDEKTAGDFSLLMEPDVINADILGRGGFTEFVVDSSLSHSLSALALEAEVVHYLSSGRQPDLKYNYLGAVGAQNWLNLSADPTYGHADLEAAMRQHAGDLVRAADFAGKPVDFVSLGPGDGSIDVYLLRALLSECTVSHYYPIDISVELLQSAVSKVLESTTTMQKKFKIKAIHGDFTSLIRYKPIFAFDPAVNFISLIGYTFGNHNEAQLLGKMREAMDPGDYLLLDARLHQEGPSLSKPSKEQAAELTRSYSHGSHSAHVATQ